MGSRALTNIEKARFWSKVNVHTDSECWEWTRSLTSAGYGNIKIAGRYWLAHRLAYTLIVGDPGELLLCHTCDNRLCCNPSHMFRGTHKDNTQDAIRKGRFASGTRAGGARLTEDQVRCIRKLYVPRKFGRYKIARQLGLDASTVDSVIQGNWAWLK